ncbi:hypothetical protein FHL15_006035 [Xylaria flabelliformis]|uniref:Uncharacterized protein n=1 Tax=Xylaria flabelliformis TaxID=2512241 RepID=A0A553HYX6_9PEZI|nr:hypothetical protein FHL15_006035 [Xylaria flabelliformis]
MSLRFTPVVMALCRWRIPEYPQVSMGFKLQSISVRHFRWSSGNNQDASSSETPRDHTMTTSLNQVLELNGIRMQASRDGGRNALNILRNLEESDGNRMVLKGIICLLEYYDCVNILSVEEAEKVIAADDAGRIVHDWVSQPTVWKEIESNNENNKELLRLITYILVGAKLTSVIETWIGYPKKTRRMTIPQKVVFRRQVLWKAIMMWFSTTALISWHPQKLADEGYDFFSRKFDEFWCQGNVAGDFDKFSDYIWIYVINVLDKRYINQRHAASSRSFERCANRIIAYWRIWCPPSQTLLTGIKALNHPNRPSADRLLTALVEVARDRGHPLRSYYQSWSLNSRTTKDDYARFFQAIGNKASIMLNTKRRFEEGALVKKIVYEIWGRDSDFLTSSNLYPERLERWKRQNQEIMTNLHPRFYVPFEF